MNVKLVGNALQLPTGTRFQLFAKTNSRLKPVPVELAISDEENKFYAWFTEDDVDFRVAVFNDCSQAVGCDIQVNNRWYGSFIVERHHSPLYLETLKTHGGKLHFRSQASQEGKLLVATLAMEQQVSYSEASAVTCRLAFNISFNKKKTNQKRNSPSVLPAGKPLTLYVKQLTGKIITINIGEENRVSELKALIETTELIPTDQMRLISEGRSLADDKTLAFYQLESESTIHMVLLLRGGGSGPPPLPHQHLLKSGPLQVSENTRGVVSFGETSKQVFDDFGPFHEDPALKVQPFIIELHLKPKYNVNCL